MPGGMDTTDRMDNRNIEDRNLKKRIELLERNLEDTKNDLIDAKNTFKKIMIDLTKLIDSRIEIYMDKLNGNNSNKLIAIIKPNNDIIWIMISHNKEFEDLGYDIKEIYNKVGFKLEQKTANMLVMKKNYEGVFFIKGNYKKLYFVHKYINIFEAQNIEKDEGLIESCMIN